jgi:peptidyl-prolyl cis-trans isomerase C
MKILDQAMKNFCAKCIAAASVLLVLAACTSETPETPAPAAVAQRSMQCDSMHAAFRVNGEVVPKSLLNAYMLDRQLDSTDPAQLKIGQDKLAEFVAIAQASITKDQASNPQTPLLPCDVGAVKSAAGGYLANIVESKTFTDAELRAFYDQTVQKEGATQYLVSHVLLSDYSLATTTAQQLGAGADLDQMLPELQGKPGVTRAASLGWIAPSQLPAELLQSTLKSMQKGQTSGMLAIQGTWHFIKVVDTRAREVPSFDSVKDKIIGQMRSDLAKSTIAKIRDAAKID